MHNLMCKSSSITNGTGGSSSRGVEQRPRPKSHLRRDSSDGLSRLYAKYTPDKDGSAVP